jgi:hypothetical protein
MVLQVGGTDQWMDRWSLVAKGFAVLGYRGIVGGERDFRVSGGEISCIEACAKAFCI